MPSSVARPALAPLRLPGSLPHRVSRLRLRRRGHRRGRRAAAPRGRRRRAGRRRRLAGHLRRAVLLHPAGRDEPQRRPPELASRPFDVDRDGFVMGEGAGFVVLQRRGRPAAGGPVRSGWSSGTRLGRRPPPGGARPGRRGRSALHDAGPGRRRRRAGGRDATSTRTAPAPCSTTGPRRQALRALFAGAPPPVTAVKGTTGHMIAGSGAVEAIVTLASLREGLVPPVAGLRTSTPRSTSTSSRRSRARSPPGPASRTPSASAASNAVLVLSPADEHHHRPPRPVPSTTAAPGTAR